MVCISCSNNNPYENNLGIKPEHLAEIDTAHYTLIKWEDSVINFGTIQPGDSTYLKFKFTNTGQTLLFIFYTKTTCGCTIADAPKDPIKPGRSSYIRVTYKSGVQKGEVRKSIAVIANAKNNHQSNLYIRGFVEPSVHKQ